MIRRAPLLGLLVFIVGLLPATTSVAAPGDPLQFQSFFDGSTLPSPMACPGSIGINETTHHVYVSEGCLNRLTQFDSEGHPANFSSTGTPQTSPGAGNLIIDNSGGPNQGNIYGLGGDGLWSVTEDGTPNGSGQGGPGVFYPIFEGSTSGYGCGGLTIAANGNILWMVGSSFEFSGAELREMTPSGIPVGKGKKLLGKFFGNNCFPVPDSEGFVYMEGPGSEPPSLHKWDPTTWTDLGDTGMPTTDRQWAVDPANDDLYVVRDNKIEMVPHTEPLTKQTPTVVLEVPGGAYGLAFDTTGETAYVSEPGGAGPRISIYRREPDKAPWSLNPMKVDSIRSQEAKIHSGLISGGSQVTYHFEYGTDTTYGQSTPEVTLPYSQFPVNFGAELKSLKIGTTYHVRLVATNSAGTTYGADRAFKTFPIASGVDSCPNALARKQTGAPSASRLPRLRARLRPRHRRLRRRVLSRPRSESVRRLPRRRGPVESPLRHPFRRRPGPVERDQPRSRPLHRHPRRGRLDDRTTSVCPPTSTRRPGPSPRCSAKPTPASTPSPSPARGSAAPASRPASKPAFRCASPTANWSRGWPAPSTPARPARSRKARSRSCSRPTAAT